MGSHPGFTRQWGTAVQKNSGQLNPKSNHTQWVTINVPLRTDQNSVLQASIPSHCFISKRPDPYEVASILQTLRAIPSLYQVIGSAGCRLQAFTEVSAHRPVTGIKLPVERLKGNFTLLTEIYHTTHVTYHISIPFFLTQLHLSQLASGKSLFRCSAILHAALLLRSYPGRVHRSCQHRGWY